jgi:large subunit ribosomal protein L15
MPLVRRLPKRGFHSPFKVEYQVVNIVTLGKLAADGKLQNGVVTPEVLARLGVIGKASAPVKVLGNGELTAGLDVAAHAFSASAAEKIRAAGGKTQTISGRARD